LRNTKRNPGPEVLLHRLHDGIRTTMRAL
jgi:hypothetical protein